MYVANRIFAFFLAACILFGIGLASEGLPQFTGNPAVCAWYTNTGISNPFDRSFPENLGAVGSRGLYVYDSIDVFAKSNQGHLSHKHYSRNGDWDNWEIIDTNYLMASSPAVYQRGPNDIIVAFKGYRPGEPIGLIIMEWDGTLWSQSNQGTLPDGDRPTTEAVAITSSYPSTTPGILNGLDVFVTTIDGVLWHKIIGESTNWQLVGMPSTGNLTSAPAAASLEPGRVDVVARGLGNAYYHKLLGHPGDWDHLGGILTSAPSVSPVPMFPGAGGQRGLGIWGRGGDGAVWATGYHPDNTQADWASLGGNIASGSAPAGINYMGNHATVFVRGMDNALWYVDYDLGCCDSPDDYVWQQVPDNSPATASPVLVGGIDSGTPSASGVPQAQESIHDTPVAVILPTREDNIDRPGMDYANSPIDLVSPDPDQCRQLCASDPNCRAYTYSKPGYQGSGAKCWLKSGVPAPIANECCVSGAKSQ